MSFHGLDGLAADAALRFVRKYLVTSNDIDQLRSDIVLDWGGTITRDPGVWFEWVQAYWEAMGGHFDQSIRPGPNLIRLRDVDMVTLEVPYTGSDPTVVVGPERQPGEERAALEMLRGALGDWQGSLEDFAERID